MSKGDTRIRISKVAVDGATPRPSRYTLWDQEFPGFGLRVEPSGSKSYVIRYRANGGGRGAPERLMTLGRHGVLTPDAARKLARTRLSEVAAAG